MYGYVYKVTNVDTGSFYIGQHKYIDNEDFMSYLGTSTHPDFDLSKYDRKCFVKELIEEADSQEELYELEKKHILENLDIPGSVNSIKGISYGGKYNYTDKEWSEKSSPKGKAEYQDYCSKCDKITWHYKNGSCKGCIAKITYENNVANNYFKKTYKEKYCQKCKKITKHSGVDFENCSSCYNSLGYNLIKNGNKISLRSGTNIIIDDVSFILDVKKEGNSYIMPEGLFVTDGKSKTQVKKIIKNKDISNWLKISFYGTKAPIIVTEDHPFVTDFSDFVKARDLNIGDHLIIGSSGSKIKISKIECLDKVEDSYDLETDSGFFNFSNIRSRNCRTRVFGNVYDPENEIVTSRGNLSFTSINLPRLAIQSKQNIDTFFGKLDKTLELVAEQLLFRLEVQSKRHKYNYPFLMEQNVWLDSEKIQRQDEVREILKHGTLSIGFIGLAETLVSLIGKHHGESEEAQELGLKIVGRIREFCDNKSKETGLNFTCLATPAEGLCLSGDTLVQTPNGNKEIKDIIAGDLILSYNIKENKVEIDKVVKSWMTSPKRKVIKITFDTNQELICTPNHPIAVRKIIRDKNGRFSAKNNTNEMIEYVEAQNLKIGDRIKSNYICLDSSGHRQIKNGERIHRIVYKYYHGNIPKGYVIHHKDRVKTNNSIDNLELMLSSEHKKLHYEESWGKYKFTSENQSGKLNSFYGKKHTIETKLKISESKKGQKPWNYIDPEKLKEEYFSGKTIEDLIKIHKSQYNTIIRKLREAKVSLEPNHIVKKIEYLEEEIPVYDITVEKNSNFFVCGDKGVLVHNSGRFVGIDKKKYGKIEGVTDREYYTNSFHVPVYYKTTAKHKVDVEAPYHAFTNAGHISYIEMDGDPLKNITAFENLIKYMYKKNMGYFSVNHPVDRCSICGYTGIIPEDTCPNCGRKIEENKKDTIKIKRCCN